MRYGLRATNPFEWLALRTGQVPVPAADAIYPLVQTRALMTAVRSQVFEGMRHGARLAPDLARELGLDAGVLELLLRTLVSMGYVEQDGAAFGLSPLARRTLLRGSPQELTAYLEWNYLQWEFVENLDEVVRTGKGIDFHETMRDSVAWRTYQRAMLELARLDAPVLASRVPVPPGAEKLLDLGGSHGLLGAEICRRHPSLRATVLDLPQAVEHARRLAREAGIDRIVEHRAGDALQDELEPGQDVVLISNLLHHFAPDAVTRCLERVRAALRTGGTVAVWEIERPLTASRAGDGDGVALFFRLTSTAAAYHGDEYSRWLAAAGFSKLRCERPWRSPGSVLVLGTA